MTYTTTFPKGARWTPSKLVYVQDYLKRGVRINDIAQTLGVPASDVDLAMWVLLGRSSLTQVCDRLNGVRP